MKSAKRIIALIVSAAMLIATLLTVNVFAQDIVFPDVAEDYVYQQAIYSLVKDGIINGMEENGKLYFKPEENVTRAQFAKLVAAYLKKGNTSAITQKKSIFLDVPEDHWANEFIAFAYENEIINGYTDGTFRPDNPVTYGEAVKMLVCAKGYKSQYKPTDPWYQGWIDVADSVGITQGAVMLGKNNAPRGLVAQLIYNTDKAKKPTSTGGGIGGGGGGGNYSFDDVEADYKEVTGILYGAFRDTLTGEDLGLKKFQIKVGDTVYTLKDKKSATAYANMVGRSVTIYHEDTVQKEVVTLEDSGLNSYLNIDDEDIATVKDNTITYYNEDGREKTAKLDEDFYVVYNGLGVAKKELTAEFVEKYLNVTTGEIRLLDNGGNSAYEVAFVTSYDTFYITSRSASDDTYTFKDSNTGKSVTLINDEYYTEVTKISSAGGDYNTIKVSAIPAKEAILSVAQTYPVDAGKTKAIVSSIALKNAQIDEMSGYDEIKIGGKIYTISDYYEVLIASKPETFGFTSGDKATFYLDFKGRISYLAKAVEEMSYGYLIQYGSMDTGSSLGGQNKMGVLFVDKSGKIGDPMPLKEKMRFNGKTVESSEIEADLHYTAEYIRQKQTDVPYDNIKPSEVSNPDAVRNKNYAQLISYVYGTDNGVRCISELNTVNVEGGEDGIIPVPFSPKADVEKAPFTTGTKLKCTGSGTTRSFINDKSSVQFVVNSTTTVILVPKNRADISNYKKVSYSYFTSGNNYVVEPYDMAASGKVAKAVLVYIGDKSTKPEVHANNKVFFVQKKTSGVKLPDDPNSDDMDKILCYPAGTKISEKPTDYYAPENSLLKDINAGDLIRVALEGKEIVEVEKVFVAGQLYETNGSVSTDYEVKQEYNSDGDYHRVVYATVDSYDEDMNELSVVRKIVANGDEYSSDDSTWEPFTVNQAVFYKWDKFASNYTNDVSLVDLNGASGGSAAEATRVVIINRDDTIVAVYILN